MADAKRTSGARKVAIFGGTFDPVHHGHLIGARDVLEQLDLDRVVFVPCARSPHKPGRKITDGRHRLAMLHAACSGERRFAVTDCELRRPPPSYAIDTVAEIRRRFPRAKLFWIVGADQVAKLPSWERYRKLKREITFVVVDRPGARRRRRSGVLFLPRPRQIDISATEIRRRVKQNLVIDPFVPPAVAHYVRKRRLYRS